MDFPKDVRELSLSSITKKIYIYISNTQYQESCLDIGKTALLTEVSKLC